MTPAPAEHLLLSSLAAWAAARHAGEPPQPLLGAALTERASPRAAALFLAWVQAIEAGCVRPLCAHCADCGGLSDDLQRLVAACGLSPVAFEMGEALVAPLVRDPCQVMTLARALNAALAACGWPLPARLEPAADRTGRTLH